jgi:sporulation protein YlmC with PRC-barrel domain
MLADEIIGKQVVGLSGYDLGKVSNVEVDEKTWKVIALEIHLDKDVAEEHRLRHRFRKTKVLINVDHVQGIGDRVVLTGSREDLLKLVASSPESGPQEGEEDASTSGSMAAPPPSVSNPPNTPKPN